MQYPSRRHGGHIHPNTSARNEHAGVLEYQEPTSKQMPFLAHRGLLLRSIPPQASAKEGYWSSVDIFIGSETEKPPDRHSSRHFAGILENRA